MALSLLLAISVPLWTLVAAAATTGPGRPAVVAVCDFDSAGDKGRLGQEIAEALRTKLARFPGEFVLIERMDLMDALSRAGLAVQYETKLETLASTAKAALEAHLVVWGKVDRQGEQFTIRARVLDIRKTPLDLYVDSTFPANGFREIPFAVQRIMSALRRDEGAPDPAFDPREPGPITPDPKVLARPNLLANGDFEKGEKTPLGWEPVDGLCSFWTNAPGRSGKCIMFDTDVNWEQWLNWRKTFTLGTSDKPPEPIRGKGPKYDTVGAYHGAWLYNDTYVPVKPGQTYRISFDFKGKMSGDLFFSKCFVKGYAQVGDERREVWRAYKACRVKTDGREWEHFTRTFNPTKSVPEVKWMRVEPYSYWPAGIYYWDNLHLCEEPGE